ncbi:hypothetical protein SR914_25425 [Comamonas testosteroni]|uniref:MmcB family DNA repair protein n=1 Tax=Comamonas testosteroni (strain DSM 14576 / KF-1) TaxID=399795 RepID=B7X1R3_COMTK|nr:hypothetical protein [Comamonas testosteroni]EED68356.1 hypothetical protein CtesDRAFT_PD3303 [Comamonas testosteroni KF-1]EED68419.1 hypothetical protein CtesDRAFT_PD3366 [Comamonas testosteroni KF-1]WQG66451.1 hypothetical protein SR914_25425 [Comamonas testosteroni]
MSEWSEFKIARAISLQTLARKCVVLVDNCSWTGHECDVLGVTTDLRIIDVEVKISRSDLKADAKKDKWWTRLTYGECQARGLPIFSRGDAVTHPRKVWKHYYALPREIWKPELLTCLPSKASGVLLLWEAGGQLQVSCERRATPNRDAERLKPEQVMDVARLANLRMWDAYNRMEKAA